MILKLKIFIKTLQNIQILYPYFKKHKTQVILGGTSAMHTVTLSFFLSRIFNTKVVCISHGDDFLVRTPLSLKSFLFRNLDLVIVGTQSIKNLLRKVHHLEGEKIKVINFGLVLNEYVIEGSKEQLRREFNIPTDQFVLLSVGRHVSRKKFDFVIKAVKEIKEINPNISIKYYLLGEGEFTPELKKLAQSLSLEDEVEFMGYVDILTRNKFYKLSDIFLMPSIIESASIEGFGLVFLEANYFYTPVIGTYSGGIVEAIENGKSGLLVKPNNLDDLVEKILYLYNNPDIRYEIGKNGHNRVMSKFNWEKLIEEYINTFVDLVKH